jgi:hypothetical protein
LEGGRLLFETGETRTLHHHQQEKINNNKREESSSTTLLVHLKIRKRQHLLQFLRRVERSQIQEKTMRQRLLKIGQPKTSSLLLRGKKKEKIQTNQLN